ncbi:MAG: hypothetical protein AAGF77_01990 [Bacteroidota bacterium]
MKTLLTFLFCLTLVPLLEAQPTSITYESNGRKTNQNLAANPEEDNNPFAPFIGEWTLKNDTWTQNWGGQNDTITIPGHHTICSALNTDNSLLSIIDGPAPNGHIFWSYNPVTKKVDHLSSFGALRAGKGSGAFYDGPNLKLKLQFEGETPNTYRIYTYRWINENEYALNSVQYNNKDQPTGLFYEGNFVRVHTPDQIRKEITAILKVLDNQKISKKAQLAVYSDSIVHMAPNTPVISNKKDLLAYLETQQTYGRVVIEHQIGEISTYGTIVLMRGSVSGTFFPSNGGTATPFLTKNLFVFTREQGQLKIAKIIYNQSPVTPSTTK